MTLFVVATPLGNLSDLSTRAKEVLTQADVVFAEDTRVTRGLMQAIGASVPLVSAHEHNEQYRIEQLLNELRAGKKVALVSDAGTPIVSDPGMGLVAAAAAAGFEVVSIPGPSAVVTALAASGFPGVPFAFFGFLPRSGTDRTAKLADLRQFNGTIVLFESKERITDTLGDLAEVLGDDTPAVLGRELTKIHETYYRGSLRELSTRVDALKGEMTLVIGPRAAKDAGFEVVENVVAELLADPRPMNVRVKELVLRCGVPRKDAYRMLLK